MRFLCLTLLVASIGCTPFWKKPGGTIDLIRKSEEVKIMSYEIFVAYYEASIETITYEIEYANLSESDAWAKKKALDLKAEKVKKILKQAQEVQVLLAAATDLKNAGVDDPTLPTKITEYTVRLMTLLGQASAVVIGEE